MTRSAFVQITVMLDGGAPPSVGMTSSINGVPTGRVGEAVGYMAGHLARYVDRVADVLDDEQLTAFNEGWERGKNAAMREPDPEGFTHLRLQKGGDHED